MNVMSVSVDSSEKILKPQAVHPRTVMLKGSQEPPGPARKACVSRARAFWDG